MKTFTAQKMKCSCSLLLAAIVFSVFSPLPGMCQSDDLAAAKAVSEKSFDVLKTGKADEYAKLMMPSELDRFKSAILLIADMAKAKGQEQQILTLLEAPDRASLEKLTSEEFLARVMKRQMTPEVIESTSKADFKVIGQVKEGDDIVHCVYSLSIPGDIVAARTNVVSLKKGENGWGMLLTSDLDKMLQMLKIQFAKRPDSPPNFDAQVKSVKVLGTFMSGDKAYVVVRSITSIFGANIAKVAPVAVEKTDDEYKLVTADDKAALEKAFEKKFGVYATFAKDLTKVITAGGQGKTPQGAKKKKPAGSKGK